MQFENFDLENLVTPVDAEVLEDLLTKTHDNKDKTAFLVNAFKNFFLLGYNGPDIIQQTSANLPLEINSELELWNKVMKEVKLKCFPGPFKEIPFENYIQSPIGLVPKDGGMKTRLIFHLSHPRIGKGFSVKGNTPRNLCKVHYSDFDMAIARCLEEGKSCRFGKSDIQSAFRNLGMAKIFSPKSKRPRNRRNILFHR